MAGALVQLVLLLIAGALMFALARSVTRQDRAFGIIIALGLLGRSLLGQLLFWISWLDLIPRGIHHGHGVWFFAIDGWHYMKYATATAREGVVGVFTQPQTSSAATYLDLLSAFALFFGAIASIGVLLNVFCYVGMCWVIAHFSRDTPEARTPALFALLAITFYPTGVVWSSQPLKDTLLHFLLVALVASALVWYRAWQEGRRPVWILVSAAGMWLALWALAGSRWYLGIAILASLALFLLLVVARARGRRIAVAAASLVLLVLLTKAFAFGAEKYIPTKLRAVLFSGRFGQFTEALSTVVGTTVTVRRGFVRSGGSTEIRVPPDSSAATRWTAGLLAATVPNFALGIFDFVSVGGGRGLLWFADVDTLIFDAVVITSIVLLLRRRRMGRWSNPVFWLVLSTAVLIAVPLLYAITNFGTLLRLRGMIYVPLALAPAVFAWGSRERWVGADETRAKRR